MQQREETGVVERRSIAVEGIVQGVGFRPFVHGLATALRLSGHVRNCRGGVLVEVEGEPQALDDFVLHLTTSPPPLASIHAISSTPASPRADRGFVIAPSDTGSADGVRAALVPPDVATCDACLAELFDPADRRHRHPFISCTHCGPRFTIVTDVPYDRPRTTMAAFPLCEACRREYENPADRRFHAQPIACPACGPTLALVRPGRTDGNRPAGEAALRDAVAALARGLIVAVKGLGGYHLACDATDAEAVERLRARKRREAKPLAVMVRDLDAARALCAVGADEAALLASPSRPIVLLAKRADLPEGLVRALEALAPRNRRLGVMLPYTPVHHLLLADLGRPLVMTSGNRSGEPIAYEDADALERLGEVADLFLTHDRPIAVRCDDSVVRASAGAVVPIRRSRGLAPQPLRLDPGVPVPVLGVGGHLKNTFCLARGRRAFLSHHVGDLDDPEAYRALAEGVGHYARLFDVTPELVAHDLHPDYLSTRLARELSGVTPVAVQHHHAHAAACLAEHGVTGPALAVVFDGTGLGTDGAIWGGEFLLADRARFERLAHLAYVPLPGGDAAAREPWRVAAAHLWSAYGGEVERLPIRFLAEVVGDRWPLLRQMLARRVNSPPTSSVGRLFDAVASLAGVRHVARFEAEAAAELESIVGETERTYPVVLAEHGAGWVVETAPLVRGVVDDVAAGRPAEEIAGAFHNAVRDLVVRTVEHLRRRTGLSRVALTGGVFQNARLAGGAAAALEARGFEVLAHRRVPCNDGGLALGQAVVAAATGKAETLACA